MWKTFTDVDTAADCSDKYSETDTEAETVEIDTHECLFFAEAVKLVANND